MTIERQDYERAIRDLENALNDPRNESQRETIEGSLALLRSALKDFDQ
jgi:hypothetical protein